MTFQALDSRHGLPRRVVYTALFGDYETLNEQYCPNRGALEFICFTDNPALTSSFWKVVCVPTLGVDPRRESRRPKILAHEYLADYDESLYIDNSVELLQDPSDIFDNFLSPEVDFVCLRHPDRDCIYAEAEVVKVLAMESPEVVDRQMAYYRRMGHPSHGGLIAGTVLLRRHLAPGVARTMAFWFDQVLRHAQRDQLSFNFAARVCGLKFVALDLNLRANPLFRWPVNNQRKQPAKPARPAVTSAPSLPVQEPAVTPGKEPWRSLGGDSGERVAHEVYADVPRKEVVAFFSHPPRRLLEIGCATGATAAIVKALYPQAWVAGIELSEAAAEVARQRMDVVISEKFEETDLEAQGIFPGSIDTVILADVLEHMYDPWGVLVRLKPYLTADAQVIASIPNIRNLWLINELTNGRFPYASVGLLDITHIRFFTRGEIERLFVETGYAVEAWGRNLDARLYRMQMEPGSTRIETEKFILKDVTAEEFEDLKCLQFLVRATPRAESVQEEGGQTGYPMPAGFDAGGEGGDGFFRPGDTGQISTREVAASMLAAAGKARTQRGPLRIAVYSVDVSTSACPQIRFFAPLAKREGVRLLWGVSSADDGNGVTVNLELDADIYVISRLFPGPDSMDMVDALFAKGKPVVYETDDLLIDLPADNMHAAAYAEKTPFIEAVMRRAHGLVVSTPELAMRLAQFNRNVFILPNQVDFARLYQPPPDNGREVRIGVIGTSTRGSDFALIDDALRQVCRKFGKRVRLIFVGGMPEGWQGHPQAEKIDFLPEYAAYGARLKGLRLDIGVAPLADNDFNACKSPLKWLEFSALGMAGVFSFVPAYKQVIEQGETGLLVDNFTDKWVAALSLLIEYPEKRLAIAIAAQREVLKKHALQSDAGRAASLYRRLATSLALPVDTADDGTVEAQYIPEADPADTYYALWQGAHVPQVWDMTWIAAEIKAWSDKGIQPPVLHWGAICPAGREAALARNIRDLHAQYYQSWRFTVVAEVAAPLELAELERVEWRVASPDRAIATLNAALLEGGADFVGSMEAGDGLPPHATFTLARHLMQHPDWVGVFSDEDRLDADGKRHSPYFKPEICPHRLRAAPFSLGGAFMLSRGVFAECGGFDAECAGVEVWDMALRLMERHPLSAIGHVADVLSHRDESASHATLSGDALLQLAETRLRAHLARSGWQGEVGAGLLPGCFELRPGIAGQPLVSILLPVGQDVVRLQSTLPALIENTAYSRCEILLLHGPDVPQDMGDYLAELAGLGSDSLRVLAMPDTARWAQLDVGALQAHGEYLLCLHPALQVMHADWLDVLLGLAQQAGIGAVGARLVDDQGKLTHAGWVLGLNGMSLGDSGEGQAMDDPGYFGRYMLPQTCSALDGACLLVNRTAFTAVGGLGSRYTRAELVWTDFCLRVQAQGLRNLWTPHATLLDQRLPEERAAAHIQDKAQRESTYQENKEEIEGLAATWSDMFADDPAYNRNLSLMLPYQVEPTPALCLDTTWRPAPRILSIHADTMGCGEYRIIAPMRALQRQGRIMGWDAAGYFHPREYARMDADSMVMQRQLTWAQIELIERIARFSRAFRVYELDDLVTNLPILSSQKKVFVEQKDLNKRFRKALSLFHRFVVSTEYLAETYRGYSDELVVVPNYLERLRWDGLFPLRLEGKKARVGWAGSVTHAGDLRLIVDVVKETASEVDWVFFGMCPDSIRHLVKEFHEPVKLINYAAKLASLNLDLAIAPLEDVPFNHAKSHLRLLEYGVLGYPVICTDITPYRGAYPVTRVPNKFKAWVDAIRTHVNDRAELARRGDALRDHIQANWMLEDHLDVWLKAWLP
jgi:glycosyltransferase involved in cell wall biosynthesis